MHYVYFIKGQRGNIKIGVSRNPQERLDALQVGHAAKLKILEQFPFESRMQAFDMEAQLHRRYRRHRLRGEWFKYDMYLEFTGRLAKIQEKRKKEKRRHEDHRISETEMSWVRWARENL